MTKQQQIEAVEYYPSSLFLVCLTPNFDDLVLKFKVIVCDSALTSEISRKTKAKFTPFRN